jgi:transposase
MTYTHFIGIDISKATLDIAYLHRSKPDTILHFKISNDERGLLQLQQRLIDQPEFSLSQAVFCMEHTGIYNFSLLQFLDEWSASIWLENATQIKRSLGLLRGKNDKIYAIRIAQYSLKFEERIRLWKPAREQVDKMRQLMALRSRLIESKKRLTVPVEEFKQVGNEVMAKTLYKAIRKSIKALDDDLVGVEQQIQKLIDDDDHLRHLFQLATSVVGIGFVTAVNLIVHTNEFKVLTDPRKLACYCGVVPFDHSSGSSLRAKPRVSHMANKKLKTNLHMGAMVSIKLDPGLKNYYDRKVEEGKNKMSVLNAIRNKLISRVLAVVKRGTPYQKNYLLERLVVS